MERIGKPHRNNHHQNSGTIGVVDNNGYDPVDCYRIHSAEVSSLQIDSEANFRCASQILEGQISLFRIFLFKEGLGLSEDQADKIGELFEKPKIKRLVRGFNFKVSKQDVCESMKEAHAAFMERVEDGRVSAMKVIDEIKTLPQQERVDATSQVLESEIATCDIAVNALDEIVLGNLKLGMGVAKKYPNKNIPLLDRCQHAYKGLMDAAVTYNHLAGFEFGTYAYDKVKQEVTRAIANYANPIRIPVGARLRYMNNTRVVDQAKKRLKRDLTKEEMEAHLEGDAQTFHAISEAQKVVSLNEPVFKKDEEGTELGHLVASMAPSVESEVIGALFPTAVNEALDVLTKRDREIIALRFGLEDGVSRTFDEISEIIGGSRQGIQQRVARILKKLRGNDNLKKLYAA